MTEAEKLARWIEEVKNLLATLEAGIAALPEGQRAEQEAELAALKADLAKVMARQPKPAVTPDTPDE